MSAATRIHLRSSAPSADSLFGCGCAALWDSMFFCSVFDDPVKKQATIGRIICYFSELPHELVPQ